MAGSIYQVGVHLHAKDGVSGVLANISKSLLGLHGGVEKLQKGFNSLQVGLLGAAAAAAGLKIGHVTEKLVEHGFQMQHWKSQMMAAGASSRQVAAAVSQSWVVAGKNVNTTASDNLKNIIELNKVTGNWAESMKLLPTFTQAEVVLSSVKAEGLRSRMTGNSTQTLNFARGLEELGVTSKFQGVGAAEKNEALTRSYAQEYIKTMIASRGLFDGNALFAMTNNSGGAAQNWDKRMATVIAPILGEVMKASKMGNADYMAIRSLQGGHITSDAAAALVKNHLARLGDYGDKNADVYQDKRGFHLKPNSSFAAGMEKNLWDWSTRILAKMKANGVDISDQHQVNAIVNESGSNKSLTMMLRALLEPATRNLFEKEFAARDRVPDDAAGIQQDNDPFLKLDALKKKWDDFLTALGGPLVEPAMKALDYLTAHISSAAQYFASHQDIAEKVGTVLVGLSVGLTALGAVLVGGAIVAAIGAGGWLVLGVAALATAFKAVAPKQFEEWFNGFKTLIHGLATFNWKEITAGIGQEFSAAMHLLPGNVTDAIGQAVSAIAEVFKTAISGMLKDFSPGGSIWNTIHNFLTKHVSYQGAGIGGGGLINASYGGPANDNSRISRPGGLVAGGSADAVISNAGGSGFNTRGVRNMNIGNIGYGPWARAHGAIGAAGTDTGHGVAVFPSFEVGSAAVAALAGSKYRGGARSIAGLIAGAHGWTPGNMGAARNIAAGMGISPFADAHLDDPAMMEKFKSALSVQELGPAGARYARQHMHAPIPPRPGREHTIHVPVHLDGKIIAKVITKHQVAMAEHPNSIGAMDTYGSHAGPGTDIPAWG